jgi:predicted enzyme related to lactoylglutathione lyase
MPQPRVMHWDLYAGDAVAQRQFYTEVFDWIVNPPDASAEYGWFHDQRGLMLGGIGQADPGEPSGLAIFVQVDDVATYVEKAMQSGGSTYWGPRRFPDGMVTACVGDPEGNGVLLIAPGESENPYATRPVVAPDRWSWEIHANDPEQLLTFYRNLFGWTAGEINEWGWAPIDTGSDGGPQGAVSRNETARVMILIVVDDLEAILVRAVDRGARVVVAPWQVTATYRMAVMEDREGLRIGLATV